jgi:hypothetical protein
VTDDLGPRDHPDLANADDGVAARLRDALSREAAMITPAGDGLHKIRERVESGHRAWWRHPAVALVAAAVTGLAVGGAYVGLRGDDNGTVVADDQSPTGTPTPTSTATPTPSGSPSPSSSGTGSPTPATTSPTAAGGSTVYVYYLHDDGQAPRLYREQHAGVGSGGPAEQALRRMLQGTPDDPDYATPWDDATLRGYTTSGSTATVNLSKFVALGAELESVAVQEIVYTVTANDPSVRQVRLLVNGATPASGHSDWSKPVTRAPRTDVQGLIWLLAPAQGATVRSPVSIDGFGTAFEGTVSWDVRKDGQLVAQGATQGGSNGEFGPFHDTVRLDPGTYELSAYESSAKDGQPTHIDTKNVTVR